MRTYVLYSPKKAKSRLLDYILSQDELNLIIIANLDELKTLTKKNWSYFLAYGTKNIKKKSEDLSKKRLLLFKKVLEDSSHVFNFFGFNFFDAVEEFFLETVKKGFERYVLYLNILERINEKLNIKAFVTWSDVIPELRLIGSWCRKNGIPTIFIADAHYTNEILTDIIYSDVALVISERQKRWFVERGNSEKKFIVTGNPEWDVYFTGMNQGEAKKYLGLDCKKPLIVIGPGHVNVLSASSTQNLIMEWVSEILEALAPLRDRADIILKIHPSQASFVRDYEKLLRDFEGVRIELENVEVVVKASDIFIIQNSNIGIEAFITGAEVICHKGGRDLFEEGDVFFTNSISELSCVLKKLLENLPEKDKRFKSKFDRLRYYNYSLDGKATERIYSIIKEVAYEMR